MLYRVMTPDERERLVAQHRGEPRAASRDDDIVERSIGALPRRPIPSTARASPPPRRRPGADPAATLGPHGPRLPHARRAHPEPAEHQMGALEGDRGGGRDRELPGAGRRRGLAARGAPVRDRRASSRSSWPRTSSRSPSARSWPGPISRRAWWTRSRRTSQPASRRSGRPTAPESEARVGGIEERIKTILENEIRPAVAMDGGDVVFAGFHDGVVEVVLQGSCAGCPSSTATLRFGIEARLRDEIPEVTRVVQV